MEHIVIIIIILKGNYTMPELERERERETETETFIRNNIHNGVVSGAAR